MRVLPKLSVLCAFLVSGAFGLLSVAVAQQQPKMIASPFIAAESPNSRNFLSSIVSTGKRNPFLVSTNSTGVPIGTYPGVILSSEDSGTTFRGLDSLSFSYKGPSTIEAVVEFTAPGRPFQRAFATFPANSSAKGEFTTAVLDRKQLGIPENSSLNKVVLVPSKLGTKGHFLVDDIQLNGNPVRKLLDTLFFSVDNGSPGGPLGAVKAAVPTGTNTGLTITNKYSSAVTFFMQLQPITGCSAPVDVQTVFPTMTYVNQSITTSLGYVTLGATGTPTASLTTAYQGPISANFSVGSFNQLCGTNIVPNGVNLAECALNNSCQGANAQETLDISLVNGLNSVFRVSSGGTKFTTVTNSTPPATIVSRSQFENSGTFFGNLRQVGVFPYGCTNCTNNSGAFSCPPPGPPIAPATSWTNPPKPYGACNPDTFLGCVLSRNASNSGGTVTITYLRPSN